MPPTSTEIMQMLIHSGRDFFGTEYDGLLNAIQLINNTLDDEFDVFVEASAIISKHCTTPTELKQVRERLHDVLDDCINFNIGESGNPASQDALILEHEPK